ncbi:MAG: glycyl radical protein [Candidatus Thorarchaeota archaeon]
MTSRTQLMRERMLDAPPTVSSERAYLFTESLKLNWNEPSKIKLAKAFAQVLRNMTIRIEQDELIVGNMGPTPRSCQIFPEYSWTWIDKEFDTIAKRTTEPFLLSNKDRDTLREVFRFWKDKSIAELAAKKMPDDSINASKTGMFTIGAPGTGIGHVTVDYKRVLEEGLQGVLKEVVSLKKDVKNDSEKLLFYEAVETEIEAVIEFANRFSELATKMASEETQEERKNELLEIAKICKHVPEKPARTFHEALQTFWFIQLLVQIESNGHSISTGRFDRYMNQFYVSDLENGKLSRSKALELLEMLWIKFASVIKLRDEYYSRAFAGHPMFQNLTIGGQDENGNDMSNEVTELVLETTANMRVPQPTVSFRWHKNTPESIKLKVVEVISKGLGMPGIFNDGVVIPMMEDKGTEKKDAFDYSILGCVEPIVEGKTDARPNVGYVNLPKILEITLYNGRDPRTGNVVGLETGDPVAFGSFGELWNAFAAQIDNAIEMLTMADRVAAELHVTEKPTPLTSALIQDCIAKGMTMQEGGAKYNSGGIMGVGVAIVADSLEMLRKYVFESKKVDMAEMMNALKKDFKGYEELRARLENDPQKYGNDLENVDFLARDTGRAFCNAIQSRITTRSGPYHGALFSVSMYIPQGEKLGATPDGRKSGIMLSDGVSPTQNRDVNGPTAAMKSVARLDHGLCYNGTLYNMKFTPDFFDSVSDRKMFINMIDAYFELGGLHIQFNVVSREVLEDAKVNPLDHRDLIVRVAGYSAYFIELDPFVQDEVIARTEFSRMDLKMH